MNEAFRQETYPLAPLQEGMLFQNLVSIGTDVDIQQIICSIHEKLNIESFQRAWGRVVERHAILRSKFEWEEITEPKQVVLHKVPFKGEFVDWKTLSPSAQQEDLEAYILKDRALGFNLGQAPLMRLTIFELAPEEYKFVWTFHHILMDGRAFPLILEEVFTFYEAFVENRDIELDTPRPYKDYIMWVGERDPAKDEKFWRENLAGFTSPTPLPMGASVSAGVGTFGIGSSVKIRLSGSLTSALRHLASTHGLSMNTLVEGAWALLLSRYNSEEDILYGTVRTCRRASIGGAESMIGLLMNTVPARVKIQKETKVLDWLHQLRQQHAQMREHIHSPLHQVQRWSEITHGSPLFESIVVFDNYYLDSYMRSKGGRWLTREFEFRGRTNYPLTLNGYDDDEMVLMIKFDEGRFTQETVDRMLGHLQMILQKIPENLDKSVAEISILTESERSLLPDLNTVLAEPKQEPVTVMFEVCAKKAPDYPAIAQNKQLWTYGELSEKSNAIEQTLRRLARQRKDVVAILGSRSFGFIAGMIGVLKSGSILLSIDGNLPRARQMLMLQEAKARTLMYVGDVYAKQCEFEKEISLHIIHVDPDTGQLKKVTKDPGPDKAGAAEALPEDAAYIFFTSGTTGMPKGVLGAHRGLSHFVNWERDAFEVGPHDRCAQLTGLSFDAVLRDIFLPLTSGATLCLPDEELLSDPNGILPWLDRERISVLHTVPTLAHSWLADGSEGVSLRALRYVFFVGEPLMDSLVRHWRTAFSESGKIVNFYGPTETTLIKCFYPLPANISPGVQPLGKPLPQTQALVLGPNFQLCGIGEPGEIAIRTPFRSFGYINAPEEGRKRFAKNPFNNNENDLVYFTGDRGRYRPDGSLEFLGRLDNQVKIRGIRVELGEIESVLGQHEAVSEVVVVAREDAAGEKRLVAYIVPEGASIPSVSELRAHLKKKLPDYMMPNAFMILEKFPITPNGKVDRRALPEPEDIRPELDETYEPPRTPVEKALAEIWAEVLGVKRVGVNDNFFELGGHSLLAVRLFVRIRKWAKIDLPLAILFKSPTIRALAEVIDSNCATASNSGEAESRISSQVRPWHSLVPIHPEGSRPPLFLVHAVGGNLLYYHSLLPHLGQDQPVYGLQARGVDGLLTPHSSIVEMAKHYIAEIRSVQSSGPYFLGGASFGGTVIFEIAQQLSQQGEEIAFLALLDSIGPGSRGYSYSRNPVRMRLTRMQGDIMVRQDSLPVYLTKRIYRYLSNRMRGLRVVFTHMMKCPIPLELRETYLWQNHYKALRRYRPHPYLGTITLFRGPAGDSWPYNDPELGWKDIAKGELRIIVIPARHHEFVESAELGIQFTEKLKEAQDRIKKQK
ncbi:MAG: amino acid adenylation domain-containing protein [Syntrophaceae bacterium]